MVNLVEADNKLEEDYQRIMKEGHLIKVLQHQVISEYKKSPKLTEDVVRQFSEGYQDAKVQMKERIRAAGLDPKILDSSDEEDEGEEQPPHYLTTYIYFLFLFRM